MSERAILELGKGQHTIVFDFSITSYIPGSPQTWERPEEPEVFEFGEFFVVQYDDYERPTVDDPWFVFADECLMMDDLWESLMDVVANVDINPPYDTVEEKYM